MKKFLLLLLILNLTYACTTMKNNSAQAHVGEWVLIQRSGGITGQTVTFDPEKKQHIIKITPSTLSVYENSHKLSEKPYTIEKGTVIESSEPQNILKTGVMNKQSINVENEQLILKAQCYDCFTEVYQRIK
ncbi:hypothetical protein QW060_16430 [Myroides ceti]|uniref:Lipoprotein n=1 Tax=Paenimyroides ceti TaxID=395087 RepID=A0ABT8CWU2_9FLAO|nr:hypothetical protein [Paenimyroides ceti]MDN3708690.1 hypothetical protein [Paenimyroides ceti]